MEAILNIAHLTWLETRRRRIALAAVVCGVAFLSVYAVALYVAQENNPALSGRAPLLLHRGLLELFMLAGLYVVNFLTLSTAVLLAVDTLSGEISSGVMQTLASKPVHRAQIVLGKWTAYLAMTIAYLLLMSCGIVLIVKGITGFLQPHLERALPLMALEAAVLLTITIAGGTRFSTVTTGIVGFAFYGIGFIGGWVEQIGVLSGKDAARYIGTAISLVSPGDALWRLAAHHLIPPMLPQLGLTPFASLSVPSPAMVVWAVGFVVVCLLLAVRSFSRRAL